MSDVVQIAENYRHRLETEITKVEEFFCFAEKLLKEKEPQPYSMQSNSTGQTPSLEPLSETPADSSDNDVSKTHPCASPETQTAGITHLFRGAFEAS
jgi:hypothetical protein